MAVVANTAQKEHWVHEGEQWVHEAERFDAMNEAFGEAMLEAAGLGAGERVLDVGCGNGATSLEAAGRVAPGGSVLGIDISPPMLALARRRAGEAGLGNVEFVESDAQVHPFDEGGFDVVVSRFGTMFFEDPEAAFANLHRATRAGGRLVVTCWQDVLASEWTAVPGGAAATHLGFPDFGPPGAPGPFALAEQERLEAVLEAGGFRDIGLESITKPMWMGRDVEDVLSFLTSLDLIRQWLEASPDDKVAAARDAVREALAPYLRPEGLIMSGTAWLVVART